MRRFGLLGYTNSGNLGDEIQSLAARQFLPQVDCIVDRDYMDYPLLGELGEGLSLIGNGWYGHAPETWPPPPMLDILFISLHLSNYPGLSGSEISATDFVLSEFLTPVLRRYEPIGARDLETHRRLQAAGVESYFSGCLTLTLNRTSQVIDGNLIILNDLPDEIVSHVRRKTTKSVLLTTHFDQSTADPMARLERAQSLLDVYQRASCVITSRLHCALPCLALGVPVLMLRPLARDDRFSGLDRFYRNTTAEAFITDSNVFDINNPPPNDRRHLPYRSELERRTRQFVSRSVSEKRQTDEVDILRAKYQTLMALRGELRDQGGDAV